MKCMARQALSLSDIEFSQGSLDIVKETELRIFMSLKKYLGEDISLTDIKIEWFAEVYNTNNGEIYRVKWVKGEEIPRHTRTLICEGSNIDY